MYASQEKGDFDRVYVLPGGRLTGVLKGRWPGLDFQGTHARSPVKGLSKCQRSEVNVERLESSSGGLVRSDGEGTLVQQ